MANFIGNQVTSTKATSYRTYEKDTARCFGMMVVFIKDNGTKAYNMAKDSYMYQENKQ